MKRLDLGVSKLKESATAAAVTLVDSDKNDQVPMLPQPPNLTTLGSTPSSYLHRLTTLAPSNSVLRHDDDDDENDEIENDDESVKKRRKKIKRSVTTSNSQIPSRRLSRKQRINIACMCFFAFLTGTDFAVIIPTLWDRLSQDYNSGGTFMGVVMSSYSLSGVICGLIMGKMSDEINRTKPFYVIAVVFGIVGHILYFLGINEYVILAARAISGVGLGCSTVVLAYIARTTSADKQRTTVISLVMASRQIGLMFGPAFNIFLRRFNFVLFDTLTVDRKSAPGLFMAALWFICFFVISIFYRDSTQKSRVNQNSSQDSLNTKATREIYRKEFFRVEIFILLAITFFTYFNQTSLETMVIPFTEMMFGWNELQNSILFCIGGIIIILSYVFIRLLTLKLNDRTILLMGMVSILTGLIIGCACLPFAQQLQPAQLTLYRSKNNGAGGYIPFHKSADPLDLSPASLNSTESMNSTSSSIIKQYDYQFFPAFVVFVILDVLGLPAIAITSAALFTKLIDNKVQGVGQGIQRGLLGIGTIFGPLCAGPLILKPIVLLAITLSFLGIIFIFYVASFSRFKPRLRHSGQAGAGSSGSGVDTSS